MPMHTTRDSASVEDSSSWAATGVAVSTAAGAASLLQEDPTRQLNQHLQGALETVREIVGTLVEHLDVAWNDARDSDRARTSEQRIMSRHLHSGITSGEEQNMPHELRAEYEGLYQNLSELIERPSSEVAAEATKSLALLSSEITKKVRDTQSTRREHDIALLSY